MSCCNKKTIITDEYRIEKKTEETTTSTFRYEAPKYIPLRRCPSLTSIVVNTTSSEPCRPRSCVRRTTSIRRTPCNRSIINVNVESDDCCPPPSPPPCENTLTILEPIRISRCSAFRNNDENRTTSITYKSNENLNNIETTIKYDYKESKPCCPPPPPPPPCVRKSITNLTTIDSSTTTTTTTTSFDEPPKQKPCCKGKNKQNGALTYVFNNDDENRQVTYIRQTENDSGLSLPGCLVKASETFLPVTRSVNLGAIFNGNSFGLLTSSIQIKDSFDLSFDFRTSTRNGILAIVVDSNSNNSFFIELYDSQLKATLFIDGEADSCWTDFPSCLLSNDIWVNVNCTLNNNRLNLTVKNNFYSKTHRCALRCPIRGDLFVAGHPSTICPPFVCRSRDFFCGEMRNFCINNNGIKWYGTPSTQTIRLRNWY